MQPIRTISCGRSHNLHEPLSGQEANNPVLSTVGGAAAGMLVNTSFHYVPVFNDLHQRYASSSFTHIYAYTMRTSIALFNFLFDLSIAEQVTLHMHVRVCLYSKCHFDFMDGAKPISGLNIISGNTFGAAAVDGEECVVTIISLYRVYSLVEK